MKTKEEGKQFYLFVNKLRQKRRCSLSQLCEGLCTSQEISLLESGKRRLNKLLQDAIVERLGIGAEDYEHFLNYMEYDHWEARQQILHNITFENMERAKGLLAEYCARYVESSGVEKRLEKQFYLSIMAQIQRYDGESREELRILFEEAIRLTVPALEHKPISQLILSIKELNLILEAEQYKEGGGRSARYREITEYIEGAGLDGHGMAKIYPKAVLLLCRCQITARTAQPLPASDTIMLLRLCNHAVDILRNNYRMYFLWELLDMRGQLLEQMAERFKRSGEPEKANGLGTFYHENTEWKEVLEQIYGEYQVPKETFEYCYLYVMKGVSCINDVIRIRRQMLGMTPNELCDGICDRKTLRRLERRETMPQKAIVESLFERLGLSGELTRTELITDDPEVRRLMEQMRRRENDRQWEAAEDILKQIKARVSVDILNNRQVLMRRDIILHWKKGELGNDEFCKRMQGVLELTIPYRAFLMEGEKYLTYEEQTCIQNMLLGMDRGREEFRMCTERFEDIYHSLIDNELQGAFAGINELTISFVASELGNNGEYDRSDQYSRKIIRSCLRFRRLRSLADNFYNLWWNYAEQKSGKSPQDRIFNAREELVKCVLLSKMCKSPNDVMFFRNKLEQTICVK